MNTLSIHNIPLLKEDVEYVYCHEDLELAFPTNQLEEITEQWNKGMCLELISKQTRRHPDEVFLALFHQARYGKIKRPFGLRVTGSGNG